MPDDSELEAVMRYHECTKHHFNRFAAGPGELDRANQPDPFRRYAGAVLTRLPVLGPEEEPDSPARSGCSGDRKSCWISTSPCSTESKPRR